MEFYNDATDVEAMGWTLDASGHLHLDEARWIAGIVKRFKHHKNLLWGNLTWFDPVDGDLVAEANISVFAGDATWSKPPAIGKEAALYLRRQR